jgi:hypothetical protein
MQCEWVAVAVVAWSACACGGASREGVRADASAGGAAGGSLRMGGESGADSGGVSGISGADSGGSGAGAAGRMAIPDASASGRAHTPDASVDSSIATDGARSSDAGETAAVPRLCPNGVLAGTGLIDPERITSCDCNLCEMDIRDFCHRAYSCPLTLASVQHELLACRGVQVFTSYEECDGGIVRVQEGAAQYLLFTSDGTFVQALQYDVEIPVAQRDQNCRVPGLRTDVASVRAKDPAFVGIKSYSDLRGCQSCPVGSDTFSSTCVFQAGRQ